MPIPRLKQFDSTFAFFGEGYGFTASRCRRLGSDAFRTHLLLRPVICMKGEEAARRFYDGESFTRRGALPPTTLRLLQDKGIVQQLDGEAHRLRRALFLWLLTGEEVGRIVQLFDQRWREAKAQWRRQGRIVLHDAMTRLLCDTACAWAGVPVQGEALTRRTEEMASMVGGAGSVGPKAWRALMLRRRAERWAREQILLARQRTGGEQPVDRIAHFRGPDGAVLDPCVAAVELINLIRPTVAVARFITFGALALHEHGSAAAWLEEDEEAHLAAFADEVRRFYPFFPVIGGRVRQPFSWHGHPFRTGDWVLLDLHGTDHDPALWGDPDRFRPARFAERAPTAFDLIPQGVGDHARRHRCPGEWFTKALIARSVTLLRELDGAVPPQDLSIPLNRFPTLPRSGLVLELG